MPEPGNETMELLDRATAAHSGGDTGLALRLVDDAIARLPGDDHALRTFVLVQKAGWLRESGAPSEAAGILEEVARELDRLPVSGYEAQRASLRMEQALHAKLHELRLIGAGGDMRAPAALVIAELSVTCPCTAGNSETLMDTAGSHSPESNSPRGRVSPAHGPFPQVVAGVGFEPT